MASHFCHRARPFIPHVRAYRRPYLPRIWLVRRFGACAGPRAFPKGTLHLNGEPIASPFAPQFKCKFRDFVCKMTLHLIPEPEEKASELLRDLTAKLFCSMCQPEEDHPGPLNDF